MDDRRHTNADSRRQPPSRDGADRASDRTSQRPSMNATQGPVGGWEALSALGVPPSWMKRWDSPSRRGRPHEADERPRASSPPPREDSHHRGPHSPPPAPQLGANGFAEAAHRALTTDKTHVAIDLDEGRDGRERDARDDGGVRERQLLQETLDESIQKLRSSGALSRMANHLNTLMKRHVPASDEADHGPSSSPPSIGTRHPEQRPQRTQQTSLPASADRRDTPPDFFRQRIGHIDMGFADVALGLPSRGRQEACYIVDRVMEKEQGEDFPMVERTIGYGARGRQILINNLEVDTVVRGWVAASDRDKDAIVVRIYAVEVYPHAATLQPSTARDGDSGQIRRRVREWDLDRGEMGVYGLLLLEGIHANEYGLGCRTSSGSGVSSKFLPIGTGVRAVVLGEGGERLLKKLGGHMLLSLKAPRHMSGPTASIALQKPLGFTSTLKVDSHHLMPTSDDINSDVPEDRNRAGGRVLRSRLAYLLAADPKVSNPMSLRFMAGEAGLVDPCFTLLDQDPRQVAKPSIAKTVTQEQSRVWADRRVREGVSIARRGDHVQAMDYYNTALDLWPDHKDGLIARGAALANQNKLREALVDFDKALKLSPTNANALKYREMTQNRLQQRDGRPTQESQGPTDAREGLVFEWRDSQPSARRRSHRSPSPPHTRDEEDRDKDDDRNKASQPIEVVSDSSESSEDERRRKKRKKKRKKRRRERERQQQEAAMPYGPDLPSETTPAPPAGGASAADRGAGGESPLSDSSDDRASRKRKDRKRSKRGRKESSRRDKSSRKRRKREGSRSNSESKMSIDSSADMDK